jgi:hypothetical protein
MPLSLLTTCSYGVIVLVGKLCDPMSHIQQQQLRHLLLTSTTESLALTFPLEVLALRLGVPLCWKAGSVGMAFSTWLLFIRVSLFTVTVGPAVCVVERTGCAGAGRADWPASPRIGPGPATLIVCG